MRKATEALPANKSQKNAISQACDRTLTLWQGPPGTGTCGLTSDENFRQTNRTNRRNAIDELQVTLVTSRG
eukprot:8470172-Pyramimonas_sp.AAC.1